MPRRFRLSTHRKNQERKKRVELTKKSKRVPPLIVSVQRDLVSLPSRLQTPPTSSSSSLSLSSSVMTVSLPIECYRMATASSLASLQQRLLPSPSLPPGEKKLHIHVHDVHVQMISVP